jgi:hypothetical protein
MSLKRFCLRSIGENLAEHCSSSELDWPWLAAAVVAWRRKPITIFG